MCTKAAISLSLNLEKNEDVKTILLCLALTFWLPANAQAPALEWQNTIGGSASDNLRSVIQTSDGGYLLGGESQSGTSGDKSEASLGGSDFWIVKTSESGAIEWENTIGGSLNDQVTSVIEISTGGFLVGGYSASGISGDKTESGLGSFDYWIVKLDSICEAFFEVSSITPDAGGWWVTFENGSKGVYDSQAWSFGDGDVSLEENPDHFFTEAGTYLICIEIGDSTTGCFDTYCEEIVLTMTDTFFCEAFFEVFSITPDAGGWWVAFENGSEGVYDSQAWSFGDGDVSLEENPDHFFTYGTYLICIEIGDSATGCFDTYCEVIVLTITDIINLENNSSLILISPNPSNGNFTIQLSELSSNQVELEVFNLTGAKVFSVQYQTPNGNLSETLSLNHLPEGSYLLRLIAGEQVFMERVVIQH